MSRNLMVLFLLVAVVCVTVMSYAPPRCEPPPPQQPPPPHHPPPTTPPPPPPKCPKHEVWKKCGTACQPSCKNPHPVCKRVCVRGCFCRDGLLRNRWGKCVEPCDC